MNFKIIIWQLLSGQWCKLTELETEDIAGKKDVIETINGLVEKLSKGGRMYFVKEDGEGIIVSCENGPVKFMPSWLPSPLDRK